MENKKRTDNLSFWQKFNSIHLYATKGEAFAKAMIITISWIGGVFLNEAPEKLTKSIGVAFYLFALSMIMEYVISLIKPKGFIPKIFPFLICLLNVLVFFEGVALLFDKTFKFFTYDFMFWGTIVSIFIVWLDVWVMILIEPTDDNLTEHNLKQIDTQNDHHNGGLDE